MGRGKKPFNKRTKVEQKRTTINLYRHIGEVLNRAKKAPRPSQEKGKE